MRRILPLVAVVALMIPAMAVMGGAPYEYYKDKFDSSGYGGSNGSLPWESHWQEYGEEDGPGEGNVHVGPEGCFGGNCLHLEGELLNLDYYGILRSADLSMFETVELCFEMEIEGISEAVLSVYVTGNGSSWQRVGRYPVLTAQGYHHPIIYLNDYRTKAFAVKFVVEGLVGGEVITIDNVELKGTVVSTSTTSSSTTSTSSTSTSTSTSTTSTTEARSTSTTTPTVTSSTNTTRPQSAAATSSSTTTTTAATTTTTSSGTGAGVPPQPPFDSGLRETPGGLIADYEEGMMGDMGMDDTEVLGAEITADFSLAVEYFEAARVWVAVLVLFVTATVVSGMDWQRTRKSRA